MSNFDFNWSDLAFGSKKELKNLNAIFIAAPRQLSKQRFTQFVKEYLPKGNIVLGIAKEEYITGFEGQPHFQALKQSEVQSIIDKTNQATLPYKIYTLHYFQRELEYIIQKTKFKKCVFVNGSWHRAFHNLPIFYTLMNQGSKYSLVSPFASESEAKVYTNSIEKEIRTALPLPKEGSLHEEYEMMEIAFLAATRSFDYCFQTGVSLGKRQKNSKKYKLIATSFNAVVPYQGFALHHGASREKHFSPPQDVSHYDTVHAEVNLVVNVAEKGIKLQDTSLFVNTLPCPTCSRMLTKTSINEIIYQNDHSEGYAIRLFELAGKVVKRLVLDEESVV